MGFFKKTYKFYAKIFVLAIFLCAVLCLSSCNFNNDIIDTDSDIYIPQLTAASEGNIVSVSAHSAIAIQAQTGEVYFEKNSHEKLPMASTTKIMTALVALENCDINKEISVSKDAVGVEGSSVYLYENERLTLENLLYALLLESANDAAAAIAIEIGGSVEGFAAMMNDKARELGLENTSFENPHGLDSENHYTTAYDLAKITMAAMQNPIFEKIVSTYKRVIPLNGNEGARVLINHNKLLKNYDGTIGVKTGFTKKSGRCLVSAAEHDGVRLICVTINAPNDWQDHENMLDLGFSLYENKTFYEKNEFTYLHNVVGGIDSTVALVNQEPLGAILRQGCYNIKQHIEIQSFSYAPIKEGEIIGQIYYTQGDKVIASSPLVTIHKVDANIKEKSFWQKVFRR